MQAVGSELQYGNSRSSNFYLTGKYHLQVAGEHAIESHYPLEVTAKSDSLTLILSMPMEDYVAAVLAGESGNFQSDEALKAMAVAVRTYAVHFRGRHQAEHFDFCDTTHCQDLHFSAVTDRLRSAVEATEGELLWFQGSPAATYYHQNCGGTTAAVSEVWPQTKADYLAAHPDPYCLRSGHARWESRISKNDLRSALLKSGVQMPADWQSLQAASHGPSGRVQLLEILGKDGRPAMKLSASTLRFAVDRALGWNQIKSDFYELKNSGAEILFSGRGSGHGVGLCQEGADAMGMQGKNYREILAFYFPGTGLGVSAQGLAWHRLHGEQLDVLTTKENVDAGVLSVAQKAFHTALMNSGLQLTSHPLLKIYPTLSIYRDSTGEPGWVAASTRGNTIRLQPAELLLQKGLLESTLRHEFLHILVESNTHASLPLWFREGLVLYLAEGNTHAFGSTTLSTDQMEAALQNPQSREQMQRAYVSAKTTVARLVAQRSKPEVMQWLNRGIPAGALASLSATQAAQY
ncbi:MAG TPA: SpoIID/LytB domain-containing protein [Terriglobales bacterium]|nr:SpoIID/LytB domain-containing protein [Terriglobales bacterium]